MDLFDLTLPVHLRRGTLTMFLPNRVALWDAFANQGKKLPCAVMISHQITAAVIGNAKYIYAIVVQLCAILLRN